MVLNIDGNISQSVSYISHGEVFVEERNGAWNSPYLFNSTELDEETGLYYYGARYLNPTNGMWLSSDPLFEKYVGMSPYNYCAGNPVKFIDPNGREINESENANTNTINATTVVLASIEDDKYACKKIATTTNEFIFKSKKNIVNAKSKFQNIISKSKPNSDSKSISSENTIKQKVIKKDLVKSENVSKFAKRANRILSAYCLFDKVTDNVDKGSMDGKDIYDYASWAVGAFGGIAGATASFFTELYRQAGEWFIEKVQDFNSSVEKNKVDIMSNMYYTGSPF